MVTRVTSTAQPAKKPAAQAAPQPAPAKASAPAKGAAIAQDQLSTRSAAAPLPSVALPAKLPTFKNVQEYKAYVATLPFNRLPEYAKAYEKAEGVHQQAAKELARATADLRIDPLKQAVASADRTHFKASHPGQEEADSLRREADGISGQIDQAAHDIARLQTRVYDAQRRQGRTLNEKPAGDWTDALGAVSVIADQAEISSVNRQIGQRHGDIATLQVQMSDRLTRAAIAEARPGNPTEVAQAKDALDAAKGQLAEAQQALEPYQRNEWTASTIRDEAKRDLDNLQALKAHLSDYSDSFSIATRTKLGLQSKGWKEDLDAFWKTQTP